ncbi:SPFH domain-containing protein [Pseudomonas aeruginosa]|uniref:SPFH domain-containing protein n=1 Tax=Pseudomonas aeruginosa TaxID=287 RepID=UPI0038572409
MADLYKSYGDLESMVSRLISRQVPNQIENTFGRYTAIRAVQERGQFVIDAAAALKGSVNGPVIIDSIQIENLDFSDAYERSIEDRMKAEVQVKTREQMLATEKVQAEIRVTQANAEAEAGANRENGKNRTLRFSGQP